MTETTQAILVSVAVLNLASFAAGWFWRDTDADAFSRMRDERDALLQRLRSAEGQALALERALRWCGGSADFSPDGKAREGWERLVLPLLDPSKPSTLRDERGNP